MNETNSINSKIILKKIYINHYGIDLSEELKVCNNYLDSFDL